MTGQSGSDPNQRADNVRVARSQPGGTPIPTRRVVASFDSYAAAERAVDYLSDHGFPVDRVTVVGRGLKLVERVTGRLTFAGAAGRSALVGAIIGGLFGWLFGIFGWVNPLLSGLLLALYGVLLGAVFGAAFGLITYAMTGGQRDFSSTQGLQADFYDVLVDEEVAGEALRLLQTAGEPAAAGAPERRERR